MALPGAPARAADSRKALQAQPRTQAPVRVAGSPTARATSRMAARATVVRATLVERVLVEAVLRTVAEVVPRTAVEAAHHPVAAVPSTVGVAGAAAHQQPRVQEVACRTSPVS